MFSRLDLQQSGCVQAGDGGVKKPSLTLLVPGEKRLGTEGYFLFSYCRSDTHGLFPQSPSTGTSGLGQISKKRVQIGSFRLKETTGRLFVEVLFVPPEDQSAYRSSGGAKMQKQGSKGSKLCCQYLTSSLGPKCSGSKWSYWGWGFRPGRALLALCSVL